MAISKIWIEDGCTACGLCEDICPEVFKLEDEATVIKGVNYADYEAKIKEAAESCPVEVIRYIE
jgi:ferredoxin